MTDRKARPSGLPGRRRQGGSLNSTSRQSTIDTNDNDKDNAEEMIDDNTVSTINSGSEGENDVNFGDAIGPCLNDHFRVASFNVSNLPTTADDGKNGVLFNAIIEHELGVLMMQEVGLNWELIKGNESWRKRIDDTFERNSTRIKFSYNTHDDTRSEQQWGGTGVFTQGKLKHYTLNAGSEKEGLGRWTWARYRGNGGIVLRVVSIYQPCVNKTGDLSVYAQHKNYLQGVNDDTDHRAAFVRDLQVELQEWIDSGDQIIIGGDVNDSVFHQSITGMFEEYFENVMFEMHDPTDAPKTYLRS